MGKHANERAWREYDSWRTRGPEESESLTDDQQADIAIDFEDRGREAADVQDEFGPRVRPAYRVRLMDEI
ncbi:hypothetical protein [Paraburkholderia tropica]|uniref:hypothetical protein n=1 Tax=Paraburkholderia tropica TaxID=92647 RepID=UPI001F220812|nr:hypothetical protein [Paraburkholderia tropica]